MKKLFLTTIFACLLVFSSKSQTNIFPTSGNVGIGTTTPSSFGADQPTLELRSQSTNRTGAIRGYSSDLSKGWFLVRADDSSLPDGLNIGTTDLNNINFRTATSTRMTIMSDGNVGIGTTNPEEKLHVNGTSSIAGNIGIINDAIWKTGQHTLELQNTDAGDVVLAFHRQGYSSSSIRHTSAGGLILSGDGGFNTSHLFVKSNGLIGIGTTNPDSKLTVNGGIHSQEIIVDIDAGTGPDYVFEEDYDLISLEETKAYIKANKHLPEVPSAKVMESEGLELKDMSLLLLKKIEEMTLHQIELMEEVKALRSENTELKSQFSIIEELQKELEILKNK